MKISLDIFPDCICYCGAAIQTEFHQHYAITIVLSEDSPFIIKTQEKSYTGNFCILPSNCYNLMDASKVAKLFLIYVEPDSPFSFSLRQSFQLTSEIIFLDSKFDLAKKTLLQHHTINELRIKYFLTTLCAKPSQDILDERILQVFQYIQTNLYSDLTSHVLAKYVHLSESRFRHLFKEQVGISISKYLQWIRLKEVGKLILTGHGFTRACYQAGFYDPPHFNRVFKEMFGIAPSKVLK